jgi:hypothetical protein
MIPDEIVKLSKFPHPNSLVTVGGFEPGRTRIR